MAILFFFFSVEQSILEMSKATIWFCYRFSVAKHHTEFDCLRASHLCKQKYLNARVMDMEKE